MFNDLLYGKEGRIRDSHRIIPCFLLWMMKTSCIFEVAKLKRSLFGFRIWLQQESNRADGCLQLRCSPIRTHNRQASWESRIIGFSRYREVGSEENQHYKWGWASSWPKHIKFLLPARDARSIKDCSSLHFRDAGETTGHVRSSESNSVPQLRRPPSGIGGVLYLRGTFSGSHVRIKN